VDLVTWQVGGVDLDLVTWQSGHGEHVKSTCQICQANKFSIVKFSIGNVSKVDLGKLVKWIWTKEYEAHIHFTNSTLKYEMTFGRWVLSIIYKGL
jgi:hypothetical protein